mgnify:FL=1
MLGAEITRWEALADAPDSTRGDRLRALAAVDRLVDEWEAARRRTRSPERLAGTARGSAGGKWEVLTLSPGARWAEPQGSLFAAPAMPERAPGGSAMSGGVGRG